MGNTKTNPKNNSNYYISELLVDFIEDLEVSGGRSKRTAENYALYIGRLLEFAGEELRAKDITNEFVRKYRLWLNRFSNDNNEQLSLITQSYHLIALRVFLKYLSRRDIESLSADKIILPKTARAQVTFLHSDEIERLLEQIDLTEEVGLRDRALIELLFSSGLRVSELVSLNVDEISPL